MLPQMQLLGTKPLLYAANVKEDELANPDANPHVQTLKAHAAQEKRPVVVISAQIEAELSALSPEERDSYLESLGVSSSGVNNLIRAAFELLGLKMYFTAGKRKSVPGRFRLVMRLRSARELFIQISNVASFALK